LVSISEPLRNPGTGAEMNRFVYCFALPGKTNWGLNFQLDKRPVMLDKKPENKPENVASTLFADKSTTKESSALEELGQWLPEPSFFRSLAANPLFWQGAAVAALVMIGLSLWPRVSAATSEGLDRVSSGWNEARSTFAEAAPELPVISLFTSERAMYRMAADFSDAQTLEVAETTFLLDQRTAELQDYRLDLNVDLSAGAASWMVRASDAENYYAFRLEPGKRADDPLKLTRWAVVAGEAIEAEPTSLEVPAELIAYSQAQVSVIVRTGTLTTLVNGQGVDFWRDVNLLTGGVAVEADGAVESATIRGNEDNWGRFLYNARATFLGEQVG